MSEAPEPTEAEKAANEADYLSAKANCPEGQMVCGVITKTGRPVYFHAPKDAGEEDVRAAGFRLREGREMNEYEKQVVIEAEDAR